MHLSVALAPRDPAGIRRLGDAASDPADPAYGRHLGREDLARKVALPPEERSEVLAWFRERGLVEAGGDDVLGGQRMRLAATGKEPPEIGLDDLPRRLAGLVRAIRIEHGVEQEPPHRDPSGSGGSGEHRGSAPSPSSAPSRVAVRGFASGEASGGMTPREIAQAYGFDGDTDGRGETIAVLALGGVPRREDLHAFWRAHGIPAPEVRLVHVGAMGARARDPLCRFETTMAVAWAGALAPGARIAVYLVDPGAVADPWSAFLLAVLSDRELSPTIAVTSWSCPERQYRRAHGGEVFRGLLDQAAAIGVTVIAASGDWGAYDGFPSSPAEGARVCDAPWPHVAFPAAEARVLAVGGTRVRRLDPCDEVAWSAPVSAALREAIALPGLAGGGGFSEHVGIPAWQRAALPSFCARSGGAASVVPHGRGVPDVALAAWGPEAGYGAVLDGVRREDAGGTSTAAPIWAAVIARINEARRRRGMGRLGFAQPLLYRIAAEAPEAFRAITEGATDMVLPVRDARGAVVEQAVPGYRAGPGWSPAAGLGVPDVAALARLCCRTAPG